MDPPFEDLLRRLDQLPEEFRELREGVRRAVRIAAEDPEMALTRSRKVLELVVREVYQRRCREPPGTRPLENLLQRLVREGHLPTRLTAHANAVRELGNVGTHAFGQAVTAADVRQSLTGLLHVLDWYAHEARPDGPAAAPPEPGKVRAAAPPGVRLAVVPKGLRSFDANDAGFFLDLLPGPRDEHGLPESIRFWKHRIEDPDEPGFTVGVIYGPSGCGKSSLVKAGLLPRLAGHILPVYVEATAEDTEARLLRGLRKRCPGLPGDRDLAGTVAALRQGAGLDRGQKVLIVLDQFEQWLHARRGEQDTELARALRQCDGEHVQGLALVRDDFWMALTRFLHELQIELLQGQNSAAVDLFDPFHARNVLAAFGRAFGRLPEEPSKEQAAFLDQAVAGLSQDGRVISVRLALFAEMVKGKAWAPATLREVGGTAGVGVTFLEETFSAAPNRPHQAAARAVLTALLPEQGSDIKGNMQSQDKLLLASGYARRPKDFEALLRLLDGEVRLITPTQPPEQDDQAPAAGSERYYQLTHDYLVPSLRAWLTRKQKETWRGRAELRLAERAALWQAKRENRHLPAWWEWLNIRLLTRQRDWTPPQRQMMRRAGRHYAGWGAVLGLAVALAAFGGWWAFGDLRARAKVDTLLAASTADVPEAVQDLAPYRRWADPLLRAQAARDGLDDGKRLRLALALLPVDGRQADYLADRLLAAGGPEEVKAIRTELHAYAPGTAARFWPVLRDNQEARPRRLRAACVLALSDADDPRWAGVGDDVVRCLAGENVLVLRDWAELLAPVRAHLIPHQVRRLVEADAAGFATFLAMVRAYPEDAPAALHAQLERPVPPAASPEDRQALAGQQAQAAVALLSLGRPERVWPLFHQGADPTGRTYLIHRCAALGLDPAVLARRLLGDEEQDPSVRQGLLLALGEYGADQRAEVVRGPLVERLLKDYRDDPDPGVHAAAEWLARHWHLAERLAPIDQELVKAGPGRPLGEVTKPRWYVNGQDQAFAVIPAPGPFEIRSPPEEKGRSVDEDRRRVQIDYPFAVALKLVTVAEFKKFRPGVDYFKGYSPGEDTPINGVSWYDAAAYCNWLSEREGIPEEQWCYAPREGKDSRDWSAEAYAAGMRVKADCQRLSGYRLPREAEWEYACRAGTVTAWSHGSDEALLGHYAWYAANAGATMHPAGSLKPHGLGLFDVHGNAWQWCQDAYEQDDKGNEYIKDSNSRVRRGGSFDVDAWFARSAYRGRFEPANRFIGVGFRAVRTYR